MWDGIKIESIKNERKKKSIIVIPSHLYDCLPLPRRNTSTHTRERFLLLPLNIRESRDNLKTK